MKKVRSSHIFQKMNATSYQFYSTNVYRCFYICVNLLQLILESKYVQFFDTLFTTPENNYQLQT